MAFRSFSIGAVDGLALAAAESLPNLVVICGPNGSGKSTLLWELYNKHQGQAEDGTRVSYLGPHRGWRSSNLRSSVMGEFEPSLQSYLERPALPAWKTMQPPGMAGLTVGRPRNPRSLDESFAFVKSSIANLEMRQRDVLRSKWSAGGQRLEVGDVPDLFAPLRKLIRALLPHLKLTQVVTEGGDISVDFVRVDRDDEAVIELDSLSSGEKAVVGIMLPIAEAQVDRMLDIAPESDVVPTAIIDEPETHLHPALQVLLLDEMTEIAARNELQIIVSTQSPTIVDSIDDASLFLLASPSTTPNSNQLVRMGKNSSKLEAMRSLTGSTHLLTRCRPIVFVEGERPAAKPVADQQLIETLIPESRGWVVAASGDRGTAIKAARQLREAAADTIPGVPVFALVDRDQHRDFEGEHVIRWPVAMVENLLLDPAAIWAVLAPFSGQTRLDDVGAVERALRDLSSELREDEIRLRIPALQRSIVVRVRPRDESEVDAALESARADFEAQLKPLTTAGTLAQAFTDARTEVDQVLRDGRELEAFRGKEVLRAFFERHAKHAIPGYKAFVYTLAREVPRHPRLERLTGPAVNGIEGFVPDALVEALQPLVASAPEDARPQAESLMARVAAAREAGRRGQRPEDLELLRTDIADFARGSGEETGALFKSLAQIAVPSAGAR